MSPPHHHDFIYVKLLSSIKLLTLILEMKLMRVLQMSSGLLKSIMMMMVVSGNWLATRGVSIKLVYMVPPPSSQR